MNVQSELEAWQRTDFLSSLMEEIGISWEWNSSEVDEATGTWVHESWYTQDAAAAAEGLGDRLRTLIPVVAVDDD